MRLNARPRQRRRPLAWWRVLHDQHPSGLQRGGVRAARPERRHDKARLLAVADVQDDGRRLNACHGEPLAVLHRYGIEPGTSQPRPRPTARGARCFHIRPPTVVVRAGAATGALPQMAGAPVGPDERCPARVRARTRRRAPRGPHGKARAAETGRRPPDRRRLAGAPPECGAASALAPADPHQGPRPCGEDRDRRTAHRPASLVPCGHAITLPPGSLLMGREVAPPPAGRSCAEVPACLRVAKVSYKMGRPWARRSCQAGGRSGRPRPRAAALTPGPPDQEGPVSRQLVQPPPRPRLASIPRRRT
jgi:hypothetical protein